MKQYFYNLCLKAIIILTVAVSLPSCTIEKYETGNIEKENIIPVLKGSAPEEMDVFISESLLEDFIHYQDLAEGKKDVTRISAIDYKDVTVAYLVEYREGWEIVSACKRTKAVIAHDKSGDAKSLEIDPIGTWLQTVYEEIYTLAHLSEDEIYGSFDEKSIEDIHRFVGFWDMISPKNRKENISTKVREPIDFSQYELIRVERDTLSHEFVNHLIDTHWHQWHPYNQYCPIRSYIDLSRAPTGCVALAGAQVLNYLHNFMGIPTHCPDSAYVSGHINGYIMEQYGHSTTAWNSMNNTDGKNAAVLIANVGKKVDMLYNFDWSAARTSDLATIVFPDYGINCTFNDINHWTLSNYISAGYPAIIQAESTINAGVHGRHAFIIDGYVKIGYVERYVYRKKPTGGILAPMYVEEIYTMPTITEYRMNWGWGAEYDNGFYSTTGDWHIEGYHFNINRKMICDYIDYMDLPFNPPYQL